VGLSRDGFINPKLEFKLQMEICLFFLYFVHLNLDYIGNQFLQIYTPTEDHVWFEDRWGVASLCDE
jgi:hypothetical protein